MNSHDLARMLLALPALEVEDDGLRVMHREDSKDSWMETEDPFVSREDADKWIVDERRVAARSGSSFEADVKHLYFVSIPEDDDEADFAYIDNVDWELKAELDKEDKQRREGI